MDLYTDKHYQLSQDILIRHWPDEDNAIAFHTRSSNIFCLDPYAYGIVSLLGKEPLSLKQLEDRMLQQYEFKQPEQLPQQLAAKLNELIDSDLVDVLAT